jgi:2,4-didehydro-3-deoxy-L-rhamnonate hydrolase
VTPDGLPDRADLLMTCAADGEQVQKTSTIDMIFPVAEPISHLSALLPLRPCDVVFTGTPSGIGYGRKHPGILRPGQTLISRIEGSGELRKPIIANTGNQ